MRRLPPDGLGFGSEERERDYAADRAVHEQRNVLHELLLDGCGLAGGFRFQRRSLSCHLHGFTDRTDLQDHVLAQRGAGGEFDLIDECPS